MLAIREAREGSGNSLGHEKEEELKERERERGREGEVYILYICYIIPSSFLSFLFLSPSRPAGPQ